MTDDRAAEQEAREIVRKYYGPPEDTISEGSVDRLIRLIAATLQRRDDELARLRASEGWFRDVIAKHFGYDAPGGEACNPLDDILTEHDALKAQHEAAQPEIERLRSGVEFIC